MRSFIVAEKLFLAASLVSLLGAVGCAADTASEEDAQSQENDIKKKVKPKGGNGAFDLLRPSFGSSEFLGAFTFDKQTIALDARVEKAPGTYRLLRPAASTTGTFDQYASADPVVTAGNISKLTVAGVRFRFEKPVTLGSASIMLLGSGNSGMLADYSSLRTAKGQSLYVLPDARLAYRSSADAADFATNPAKQVAIPVGEGELKEVVLPVTTLYLQLDDYDPAYPNDTTCAGGSYLLAGAAAFDSDRPVRKRDGSPYANSFVIPSGAAAEARLSVYGMVKTMTTLATPTIHVVLNRLEVDDVEVSRPGAGTSFVKGVYKVEYLRQDGQLVQLGNCAFATHTGIDLPDGTYRITSSAQTGQGTVTHVEEVSFP